MRVDDVEIAPAYFGKNRARNLRRVQSRAVAGDEGEARAKDSEAVPSLGLGQIAQRAVALV